MDKMREIIEAKQLRGEIIKRLYTYYGEDVSLNTIRTLLKYQNYYPEKDVKRAVSYLSGKDREYIQIINNTDEYWDSLVQLTPAGVNLAEGDIKDLGVQIDG